MDLFEAYRLVDMALAEDIGTGDLTTDFVISTIARAKGEIVSKASGVVAGLPIAGLCFTRFDTRVKYERLVEDGAIVVPATPLARLSGPANSILKAERVALNFVQRLSGIATLTATYVDAVRGCPVRILDTRKTTPGLRALEKYAVRMGGGWNHRMGLYDGILIKDNHLKLQKTRRGKAGAASIATAVNAAKDAAGHLRKIEVEAESLEQVKEAVKAGADAILLDNMDVRTLTRAVEIVRNSEKKIILEASGNVSLTNVKEIADTGVDAISVGALTHSAQALDISLELLPA